MKAAPFIAVPLLALFACFPARAQEYLPPLSEQAPLIINRNPQAALARLQMVLDQLGQGDTRAARVLAEDSMRQFGNFPELSLVLAYLQQRDGQTGEAITTLNLTAPDSALAREYLQQLNATEKPLVLKMPETVPDGARLGIPMAASSASLPQVDARLGNYERLMAQMVNAERQKAGLSPLTFDSQLSDISRAHSAEMRDKNYFAHESPTTSLREPMDRYRAVVQKTPRMIAENVYRVYGYGSALARRTVSEQDVRDGHEALMKSPGHRRNILETRVTRLGIGIVANAKGDMWITQMFVRP